MAYDQKFNAGIDYSTIKTAQLQGMNFDTAQEANPSGPIHLLSHSLDLVSQLCQMVDQLANRLVGLPPPPPVGTQTADRVPAAEDGVFPLIERRAEETAARVHYSMESVSRIVRALP